MIRERVTVTRYIAGALVGAAFLTVLSTAEAGYKETVRGITVKYTKDGCVAGYDSDGNILVIDILEPGGSLSVTATKDAPDYWPRRYWYGYADIDIWAEDVEVKNMSFKGIWKPGEPEFMLFICGVVGYARSLKVTCGCVGYTDCYGPWFGLYRDRNSGPPRKIVINKGWATAAVLGPDTLMSPSGEGGKAYIEHVPKSELCPEEKLWFWQNPRYEGDDDGDETSSHSAPIHKYSNVFICPFATVRP